MIKPDATLSIRILPLASIQIVEYQERYLDKLLLYIKLLKEHPNDYAGILHVQPSTTHPDIFELLDGYHKFCASVMTGRADVLCLVVEEKA